MIPKVIHYCWFGNQPLTPLAIKCIDSWKKYFPDYEIKEWNEENFNVEFCTYTKQAYEKGKWAFVSDVARFWILYNYGGIYFDTDVEVISSIDDLLEQGPFMGIERITTSTKKSRVAPGLGLAANPGLGLYKEILEYYFTHSFLNSDGKFVKHTVVSIVTSILEKHGFQLIDELQKIQDVYIYPSCYFSPLDNKLKKLDITSDTRTIHWYSASWLSPKEKFISYLKFVAIKLLGKSIYFYLCEFIKK